MSQISLEVDALAGSDITIVCREMCELANKLNIYVSTKFNDTLLLAGPNEDYKELVAKYWRKIG